MPPGAKKRKALKKKQQQQQQQQQQEAIGTSNGDNLHGGNEEHGSQDDRESDSNLSSPGSQENQEFAGTKDSSAAIEKDTANEISDVIAVERGTDVVEKPPVSCSENTTQTTAKNVSSQHPCDKEIAPVVDSVSNVVISEKSEAAETSAKSNLVIEKSGETKENGKVAAGTSRKVESARESEVPPSSEEKRLLLPGPPAVRTSWLSCCGLFDAMTGSDR